MPTRPSTRGGGCARCAGLGVVGRAGFFEAVELNARIRAAILRPDGLAALRGAIAAEGGGSLRSQVLRAAWRGEVAVGEAWRWLDEEATAAEAGAR